MVLKELGNAGFNAIMSQTWAVERGEVTWGDCTFMAALGQSQCIRAGLNMDLIVVDWDLLHLTPLMDEILLKLTLREVFLMPWWLEWGGALLCNGAVSTNGSQKVTCLAVVLLLLGSGEVGMLRLPTWEVAAKLRTLNAMIPSLSEVA